ncbi:MAG: NADH-quinone oxidoreductase subunit N [bacterium]|nr:NADH-quinone oxidoreductase subunit N [bacterium]
MIPIPTLHVVAILPVLVLAMGAFAVLSGELFLSSRGAGKSGAGSVLVGVSGATLLTVVVITVQGFISAEASEFNPDHPMLHLDRLAYFSSSLVVGAALLSCLLANGYLQELRIHHGEFYALLLLSTAGMVLLVCAVDFLSVFLGIELMSIPLYVLAGFDRGKPRSNESALKYFIAGSFATALLLYGMALVYGATGATHFATIAARLDPNDSMAMVGVGLILVGFAFKVSSVPFHQWTPDVYEGAPTAVTAFMAVTVKLAAFAALLRILDQAFGAVEALGSVLAVLAGFSMCVGNLMAIIQDNVKRMLAWSAIAQAGYLLVPLSAGTAEARAAVLFYLVVYALGNLGAFAVMIALTHRGQEADRFDDYNGLATQRPGLAAAMVLFMISLAGIPGTAGFMGKLQIFLAAVRADQLPLAILMALTSVISVYYYLRLPIAMYMRPHSERPHRRELDFLEFVVLATCAALVLLLGLLPNTLDWLPVIDWTYQAATASAPN